MHFYSIQSFDEPSVRLSCHDSGDGHSVPSIALTFYLICFRAEIRQRIVILSAGTLEEKKNSDSQRYALACSRLERKMFLDGCIHHNPDSTALVDDKSNSHCLLPQLPPSSVEPYL
jgi:hypothetical protein